MEGEALDLTDSFLQFGFMQTHAFVHVQVPDYKENFILAIHIQWCTTTRICDAHYFKELVREDLDW